MNSLLPVTSTANGRDESPELRPAIAVEANFLRLPLFALHTRGLRQLDGFECQGVTKRGDKTWEFQFRTARSTATLYPGPLSRSIHLALLSLITEQGRPLANPVSWSWRNLCKRLGIQPSGRTIRHLKQAVEATAGLMIYSQDALYSKPTGKQLRTRKALHLYDTVVFVNETLPDGSTADANYLWLSQWYLDNLNSLFTAPLDYELWRALEQESPIASRLYEFLLINFFSGTPQLRINYSRLAQFLPVRIENYLSDARKQMEPAFRAIEQLNVASVAWHKRNQDVAQLCFERGSRLRSSAKLPKPDFGGAAPESSISIREIQRTPEQELVSEFYRQWGNRQQRPTTKDLDLAHRLLAELGQVRTKALLPEVIEQLKRHWPGARTFVAIESYLPEVIRQEEQRKHQETERQLQADRERDRLTAEQQQEQEVAEWEAVWEQHWNELSPQDQDSIQTKLIQEYPILQKMPSMLHSRCLRELARRSDETLNDSPMGERA
ncbi:MAG: hypothetical protein KDA68_09475 [Planctomycetaceae bacterium]|nr:hypothetical protein [Planctomycetaceae bacterium]